MKKKDAPAPGVRGSRRLKRVDKMGDLLRPVVDVETKNCHSSQDWSVKQPQQNRSPVAICGTGEERPRKEHECEESDLPLRKNAARYNRARLKRYQNPWLTALRWHFRMGLPELEACVHPEKLAQKNIP